MTTVHATASHPITFGRILGLLAVLAWGSFVIVAPLAVAAFVHLPAGHYVAALGTALLAGIMGTPWFVFGIPVIRRFIREL